MKSQVERLITARSEEFLRKRSRRAKEAENDSVRRGLLGSPMHVGRIATVWAELVSEHASDLFGDFKGLLERLGQLKREPASWIMQRFDSHLDGLTLGTVKGLTDHARHQGEPGVRDSGAEVLRRATAVAKTQARRQLEIAIGEAELVRMHRRTDAPVQEDYMPFDDLTSDRVRRLLQALLREMDPERYASFFAYSTFGSTGWRIILMGVGQTPQKELEECQGKFEQADLEELRDAGYIALTTKPDKTLQGRLTKRALDAHTQVTPASVARPEITSGDPDMDHLAELLTNRVIAECGNRQVERLKELQVDLAKRGILGSGVEEQGKIKIAIAFMDEYVEGMTPELLALARKARGRVERGDADWIRRRIERDLDRLKTGQAGCYVKSSEGQRALGDYIQRKKAGVKSGLEIEVRTAALEGRAQSHAAKAALERDVFVSYASEDKEAVAKPIAEELKHRGFKVWYDDYEIKLGDSIPKKIDEGLGGSRFGVVVLSRSYFAKNWPKKELEALLTREADEGVKVVLPVWHGVTAEEVRTHSKMLVTKRAALMADGVKSVVDQIVEVIGEGDTN